MILLACLVIGWMLTSVTLAEWTAFAIVLAVAAAIFVMRRSRVEARARQTPAAAD